MTSEVRYGPAAGVAAEVIDGEAVIIKLSTGVYYSMDRAGALVWQALTTGHTPAEIAGALAVAGNVPEDKAGADVAGVLGTLLGEELVTADPTLPAPADPLQVPAFDYTPPAITAYRDMKDLLALDPPAPGLDGIPWNPPATRSK